MCIRDRSCDHCAGWNLFAGLPPVKARRSREGRSAPAPVVRPIESAGHDEELFSTLKKLRKQIADARSIPAYLVFSDATLRAMAIARPRTPAELLAVSGVGPVKLETYGGLFLSVIKTAPPAG